MSKKIIFASIIGNILEWYDFALFGIFTLIISQQFFLLANKQTALIYSLLILAIGYFARPLGGILSGHIGDTLSRQQAMIITVISMGLSTTLLGCIPSYHQIGFMSIVFLIFLRLLQGLAVGGEFPGSIVITVEEAPKKYQAFFGSLSLVGAGLGILLAAMISNLLSLIYSQEQIHHWAWRIPFILGIFLAGLGLYLRLKIKENSHTTSIHKTKTLATYPFIHILKYHKKALFIAFLLLAPAAIFTSIFSIYLVTYLVHFCHYPLKDAIKLIFLSTIVLVIALPIAAYLADRVRHYHLWFLIGIPIVFVATYPAFILIKQNIQDATIAVTLLTLIYSFVYAPFAPILVSLFPHKIRYSGVAFIHGLTFSIFSGAMPLLLNITILKFGILVPSYYLMGMFLLTFIGFLTFNTKYDYH